MSALKPDFFSFVTTTDSFCKTQCIFGKQNKKQHLPCRSMGNYYVRVKTLKLTVLVSATTLESKSYCNKNPFYFGHGAFHQKTIQNIAAFYFKIEEIFVKPLEM